MTKEGKQGLTLISPTLLYALVMLAAPLAMVVTFSFGPKTTSISTKP